VNTPILIQTNKLTLPTGFYNNKKCYRSQWPGCGASVILDILGEQVGEQFNSHCPEVNETKI